MGFLAGTSKIEHAPVYSYQNEVLKDVSGNQHVSWIVRIYFIIASA